MSSLFSFGQSSQSQQSSVSSGSSSEQPQSPQSSQPSSSSTNVWGWFEQASKNTKELISQAQVVATELSKQALEMKENYDSEVQKSILSNLENSSKLKQKGIILLPRESAKLEDIDLIYVTENMVGMGFPHDPRKEMHIKGNRIDDVAGYLKTQHSGRFMIWNISEESYDYSLFSDQVLEYKFPGHPAPPLGLMFKICSSIESWLDADERNIAIVHCLTGKGRTAVVLACALTWIGEFNSPMEALTYISDRKQSSIDILTIPSQRRYIQYFSNVLDGVRPRGEPLLLRRVIMNGIPRYGENRRGENSSINTSGCCPYIQLFKNGKILANGLIASASTEDASVPDDNGSNKNIRWLNCLEESVSFQIDCVVQGDLLLRCRHHDPSTGARISMFRAAFHTGYVPSGVLRLTKAQLDGPNQDDRYSNDFYIDLIFAPVENSFETQAQAQGVTAGTSGVTVSDAGAVLDHSLADKFEQMFHRDTRFWESIAARKSKTKRRQSRKFKSEVTEKFSIGDDDSSTKLRKHSAFELGHSRSHGREDEDDGDEIHFSQNSQMSSGALTSGNDHFFLSGPSSFNEMSDEELIKQLAEAADNVDADYSSGGNGNEKRKTSDLENVVDEHFVVEEIVPLQTLQQEEDDLFASETSLKAELLTKSNSSDKQVTHVVVAAAPVSSARAELQALEDLERELGLDLGTNTNNTKTSHSSTATAATVSRNDDNLDDLEDFLESLNK